MNFFFFFSFFLDNSLRDNLGLQKKKKKTKKKKEWDIVCTNRAGNDNMKVSTVLTQVFRRFKECI